jgi:leucyl/phenylalanyl-tRNA--protein transferase
MDLSPQLLLSAYCQGIFPMAHDDGNIYWYDPDPRAILPLDGFHVPRSLVRSLNKGRFEIRCNSAFASVINACAEPGSGREETWINDEIVGAYNRLHQAGFAHSVESWLDGELVGGLYGVAVQGLFAGESMFSRVTDASKVALVYLVERLRQRGFQLLDVQFMTEHLRRFGAVEIAAATYKARLAQALLVPAQFSGEALR